MMTDYDTCSRSTFLQRNPQHHFPCNQDAAWRAELERREMKKAYLLQEGDSLSRVEMGEVVGSPKKQPLCKDKTQQNNVDYVQDCLNLLRPDQAIFYERGGRLLSGCTTTNLKPSETPCGEGRGTLLEHFVAKWGVMLDDDQVVVKSGGNVNIPVSELRVIIIPTPTSLTADIDSRRKLKKEEGYVHAQAPPASAKSKRISGAYKPGGQFEQKDLGSLNNQVYKIKLEKRTD